MSSIETFEAIRLAVEFLQKNPGLKRIDGKDWTVYLVGKIIRVDIENDNKH